MADPLTGRSDPLDFRRPMVTGLISVVWPSRHRLGMARDAFVSLRGLAADTTRIEFGIAFDEDDPVTEDWAHSMGFFTCEIRQRLGWEGLGTYFARISELAAGEWIVWWGDDGRMLTHGWDTIIRAQEPGILSVHAELFDGVYPIIHRTALESIGEAIPSPFVDSWLMEVGKWGDCLQHVPVGVLEDRYDQTRRNKDRVWEEGSIHKYAPEWERYCSPPNWARRMQHAWQVKEALAQSDSGSQGCDGQPGQEASDSHH